MSAGKLIDRAVERIKNEPALLWHVVAALMALGASFGLELSAEQQASVWAVLQVVAALVVRGSVSPTRKLPRGPVPADLDPRLLRGERRSRK